MFFGSRNNHNQHIPITMASFPSRNTPNYKPFLPITTIPSISTPTHAPLVTQIPIIVDIDNGILNATQHDNKSAPTSNQHHPGGGGYIHYSDTILLVDSMYISMFLSFCYLDWVPTSKRISFSHKASLPSK